MIETEIIYKNSTERVKVYKDFDKETRTVTFYLDDKKMFPIDKDEDGFSEYIQRQTIHKSWECIH